MRKFEEFICCQKKSKNIFSNLFVFYLIPLNGVNSKPIPIYLIEYHQGIADDFILNKVLEVITLLRKDETHLFLRFLSIDGDLKYKAFQDTFLTEWLSNYHISNNIYDPVMMWSFIISDPSHLLKRLRYRLTNHALLKFTAKSAPISTLSLRKL